MKSQRLNTAGRCEATRRVAAGIAYLVQTVRLVGMTVRCTQDRTVVVGREGAYRGVHFSADLAYVIDTAFYLVPNVKIRHAVGLLRITHTRLSMPWIAVQHPLNKPRRFYHMPLHFPPLSARTRNCASPGLAGRQDRVKPVDERDAGGDRLEPFSSPGSWTSTRCECSGQMPEKLPFLCARIRSKKADSPIDFKTQSSARFREGWKVSTVGKRPGLLVAARRALPLARVLGGRQLPWADAERSCQTA